MASIVLLLENEPLFYLRNEITSTNWKSRKSNPATNKLSRRCLFYLVILFGDLNAINFEVMYSSSPLFLSNQIWRAQGITSGNPQNSNTPRCYLLKKFNANFLSLKDNIPPHGGSTCLY